MKKISRYFLIVITAILASCNTKNETPEVKHVDDFGYPLLTTGTLHNVSVVEKNRPFVVDKKTQYKIIYDTSSSGGVYDAATYIASNIYQATGAEIELINNDNFDEFLSRNDKYIIVGCFDLFESVNKTMPDSKTLDESGYYISSYGSSVFLMAYRYSGYQHAALTFLNHVVGFDMITEDTVIYEKDGRTIPDMEIIETPDYQWSHPTNNFTSKTRYGLGFSTMYSMIVVPNEDPPGGKSNKAGSTVHNVFTFLDPDIHLTYNPEYPELYHPEWYSDGDHTQLCYTAHGDKDSLELMADTAFVQVRRAVESNTYAGIINFTHNDNSRECECDACVAQKAKDGAMSGQMIRFVNMLDDRLQVYLKQKAEETGTPKREVHLQFFAYHTSLEPPKVSPDVDPTLKCNPEVMVMLAPIEVNYTKTLYDDVNAIYAENIRNWSKYCSNFTAWLYETDYHHYIYPYNTYSTMMINYRFMKECGASVMLNEGQRYNKNVTCFGKLKEYLDSKAQFDVNANYSYYTDKFFKYYFRDAAPIMRDYYEQMIAWETYLESKPEQYGLAGNVYQEIGSKAEYWPKQLLMNWLSMMDDAYKAIEKYRTTDASLYKTLANHILIETMFPKYAICDLHADTFTSEEILERRLAFKKDAESIGMVEHMEHYFIDVKYAAWGI